MMSDARFDVVVAPRLRVIERNLRLNEARAFMQAYNEITDRREDRALIAESTAGEADREELQN